MLQYHLFLSFRSVRIDVSEPLSTSGDYLILLTAHANGTVKWLDQLFSLISHHWTELSPVEYGLEWIRSAPHIRIKTWDAGPISQRNVLWVLDQYYFFESDLIQNRESGDYHVWIFLFVSIKKHEFIFAWFRFFLYLMICV